MRNEYSKAVIYCRVSSEKQVKEGNGLESQEHRCKAYAASLGLEVENVFKDEGISGGLFERPAIKELIKYLDKHWQNKYVVIFDDLKRLARDVQVHLKLKAELMGRDAQLKCLNYHFDDSAEGEFVETIFAAQNQLERKQNRRQVCQKMKARIEQGYWCFCPPIGYEYYKDKDHGKLMRPISPIASILSQGLNSFAEDRILEQVDLQKFFDSKGLHKLIGSKKVHLQLIKRLLTNGIYAGIIEYPEWGVSRRRGKHQGIISEETYIKIQRKIKKPERKPRESDKIEFPLRRIVTCDFCGKPMTGSCNRSKNPNKYYPHYTCNNKECIANPKNITASKVEDDYIELLENIKIRKEVIGLIKEAALRIWQTKTNDIAELKNEKEKEIKTIENQIEEFINLIPTTKSESVKARYEIKIEALDKRAKELENELKIKKDPNLEEVLEMALKFLGTPAETWKKSSRELKIKIHNLIFKENPRYSFQGGFGTPKLSLPFTLNDLYVQQKMGWWR